MFFQSIFESFKMIIVSQRCQILTKYDEKYTTSLFYFLYEDFKKVVGVRPNFYKVHLKSGFHITCS
jgi:hypothetical protein